MDIFINKNISSFQTPKDFTTYLEYKILRDKLLYILDEVNTTQSQQLIKFILQQQ